MKIFPVFLAAKLSMVLHDKSAFGAHALDFSDVVNGDSHGLLRSSKPIDTMSIQKEEGEVQGSRHLVTCPATFAACQKRPTLKKTSSYSASVVDLQCLLNKKNSAGLATDGYFGSLTAAAVRAWQTKMSLAVDGIVGYNTWNTLCNDTPSQQDPSCKPVQNALGARFIAYLKLAEGFVATPGASLEGGLPTVGYGHKLTQQEYNSGTYTNGLTQAQAEALLIQDVQARVPQATSTYDNVYGAGAFNEAPVWGKRMLVDKVFQTGQGGLAKFVKMMKAIHDNDVEKAKVEMLTKYFDAGKQMWVSDTGRQAKFISNCINDCE